MEEAAAPRAVFDREAKATACLLIPKAAASSVLQAIQKRETMATERDMVRFHSFETSCNNQ